MDPIIATNVVPAGQTQEVRVPEPDEQGAAITSDFETFLVMLTTQLENQDPLEPEKSSDFAVDLATFSSVEQQVQTNELLAAMAADTQSRNLANLAGWVGMEVQSPATFAFSGSPITLNPPVIGGAERTMMVVKDVAGLEVQRFDIDNTGAPFNWAGISDAGVPLPSGNYSFTVEGFTGQTRVDTRAVENYAIVQEVQVGADGAQLILDNGTRTSEGDVTAVRSPG